MLSPRTNFPAARLLDGKILVAGGSDGSGELASAEIFDPEASEFSSTVPMQAPRQGHLLIVINNNGRVLAGSGFAGGRPLEQAEYFIPWHGVFESAAPGPVGREGEIVTMGCLSGKGKLMSTAVFASPTLSVRPDPNGSGEKAILTGAGWQPGADVTLSLHQSSVTADSHGRFTVVLEHGREESHAPSYVFARSALSEADARY